MVSGIFQMRPPSITSLNDFEAICEDFDPETRKVRFTTFYLFDEVDHAFWGKIEKPKDQITLEEYQLALVHIPDERLYPALPDGFKISKELRSIGKNRTYIKRPKLGIFDIVEHLGDASFLPDLLLNEARNMETIFRTPHRNIVGYRGVRVQRGRITGIVLARHGKTLLKHVQSDQALDKGALMMDLGSAISHLHSLGLAHNDFNPENIVMDKDGRPILIDFGSCGSDKKRLLTAGTPGWTYDDSIFSDQRNDLFALGKLLLWLEHPIFD